MDANAITTPIKPNPAGPSGAGGYKDGPALDPREPASIAGLVIGEAIIDGVLLGFSTDGAGDFFDVLQDNNKLDFCPLG